MRHPQTQSSAASQQRPVDPGSWVSTPGGMQEPRRWLEEACATSAVSWHFCEGAQSFGDGLETSLRGTDSPGKCVSGGDLAALSEGWGGEEASPLRAISKPRRSAAKGKVVAKRKCVVAVS